MEEIYKIWKDTRNPNGRGRSAGSLWEISNLGNIRRNGIVLEQNTDKNVYHYLPCGHLLHRVVAELFIDNPDNLPQVDHIDGNKNNNAILNLRWVTASQNMMNPNTNIILHKKHKPLSTATRKKQAIRASKCCWITNGDIEKFVYKDSTESFLNNGFVFGRLIKTA